MVQELELPILHIHHFVGVDEQYMQPLAEALRANTSLRRLYIPAPTELSTGGLHTLISALESSAVERCVVQCLDEDNQVILDGVCRGNAEHQEAGCAEAAGKGGPLLGRGQLGGGPCNVPANMMQLPNGTTLFTLLDEQHLLVQLLAGHGLTACDLAAVECTCRLFRETKYHFPDILIDNAAAELARASPSECAAHAALCRRKDRWRVAPRQGDSWKFMLDIVESKTSLDLINAVKAEKYKKVEALLRAGISPNELILSTDPSGEVYEKHHCTRRET